MNGVSLLSFLAAAEADDATTARELAADCGPDVQWRITDPEGDELELETLALGTYSLEVWDPNRPPLEASALDVALTLRADGQVETPDAPGQLFAHVGDLAQAVFAAADAAATCPAPAAAAPQAPDDTELPF